MKVKNKTRISRAIIVFASIAIGSTTRIAQATVDQDELSFDQLQQASQESEESKTDLLASESFSEEGFSSERRELASQPQAANQEQDSAEDDAAAASSAMIQEDQTIKYVPMPVQKKPRLVNLFMQSDGLDGTVARIGRTMKEFIERMSRGKVLVTPSVGPIDLTKGKGKNNFLLVLVPGMKSRIPYIGNEISAKHELGHQFDGLGHANTRIWETQTKIKQSRSSNDPFDPMTNSPGVITFNAPHLHILGWYGPTELAYAEPGKEYVLRLNNDGNRDFKSLKALFYQVPTTFRRLWFSYVKVAGGWKTPKGMPGTAIAVHSNVGSSTYLEGLIGMEQKTNIRSGLILEVIEATKKTVRVRVSLDPNWVLQGK